MSSFSLTFILQQTICLANFSQLTDVFTQLKPLKIVTGLLCKTGVTKFVAHWRKQALSGPFAGLVYLADWIYCLSTGSASNADTRRPVFVARFLHSHCSAVSIRITYETAVDLEIILSIDREIIRLHRKAD